MKDIAIGMLLVVFLSILIEPLVDTANVYREKIIVGSAITNSCRAAKDRSLIYDQMINLDAEVDEELFVDYFSEAFEKAMNMTLISENGTTVVFRSNNGKYNDFKVTLSFDSDIDYDTEQVIGKVRVYAESDYKFKTKYLKLAEDSGDATTLKITSERMLLLSVRN
jgi:hypothetical protein